MEAYSSWGLTIARYNGTFTCVVLLPRFLLNVLDALPVILDICGDQDIINTFEIPIHTLIACYAVIYTATSRDEIKIL